MADVSRQVTALARRCEALGWDVQQPNVGRTFWMVKMPACRNARCGHKIQLHTSPSDVNWRRVIQRRLDLHGFADAERNLEHQRSVQIRVKNTEDKAKADAKAQQLAARNAGTIRKVLAGSNYEPPQEVDADWFLNPHPAP